MKIKDSVLSVYKQAYLISITIYHKNLLDAIRKLYVFKFRFVENQFKDWGIFGRRMSSQVAFLPTKVIAFYPNLKKIIRKK